jgi:hypothetical protein
MSRVSRRKLAKETRSILCVPRLLAIRQRKSIEVKVSK